MLILTGNKAINFEQVFYFSVDVPIPQFLNMNGTKAYALIAHHSSLSDREGNSDSLVIKSYHTQNGAVANLNKIKAAYKAGISYVNLDTD